MPGWVMPLYLHGANDNRLCLLDAVSPVFLNKIEVVEVLILGTNHESYY